MQGELTAEDYHRLEARAHLLAADALRWFAASARQTGSHSPEVLDMLLLFADRHAAYAESTSTEAGHAQKD